MKVKQRSAAFSLLLAWIALSAMLSSSVSAEEEGAAPAPTTQYVELKPSFVANFGTPGAKLRFLKADVTVRVNSVADANKVENHIALLRNEIVFLLSKQGDSLNTMDGQEKLRQEILEKLRAKLKEEEGSGMIEDVLFTEFVIQR
ncbi:MAG: flagellar basal body-associated protein FliL [Hahellaceae bacterium]|nr:flagellar basal body-associated protein FliL [Hahellaceae bacterium]MCP5168165.1 flagellar basal body-associated protein FliL [Hahellaceae bacterium]